MVMPVCCCQANQCGQCWYPYACLLLPGGDGRWLCLFDVARLTNVVNVGIPMPVCCCQAGMVGGYACLMLPG